MAQPTSDLRLIRPAPRRSTFACPAEAEPRPVPPKPHSGEGGTLADRRSPIDPYALIGESDAIHSVRQAIARSEEHTSELQSRPHLVCRLLLEKKKKNINTYIDKYKQL